MRNSLFAFFSFLFLPALSQQPDSYMCPPCNSHCDELVFEKAGLCSHCGMQLILKEELEKNKDPKMKTIAFYLQDGVEILDFAGPMEVFSYAGYDVFTVSKSKDPIVTQGILKIIPDYSINDAPQADILAFFGGNSGAASDDMDVISWVQSQPGIDQYLSVCTGAFVLAEAGILNGKTATTFHNALDRLENDYPEITVLKDARFVDNGNIITTAGISAGIDGALHLVAKLQGFNSARRAAYYMEYDKWEPGDGVILTEDSPYDSLPDTAQLQDYAGKYEYFDGAEIYLRVDSRERSLYAIVAEIPYPLFYSGRDIFKDLTDSRVEFIRNKDHSVIAYTLDGTKTFKKIE